jgi:hypothetical protein
MADELKVDKLNSKNYRHWSMIAMGILESKSLWEAIVPGYGEQMTPAQTKTNNKAKTSLYLMLDTQGLDHVSGCSTAREVWEKLEQVHTHYNTWHGLLVVKEFTQIKMKDGETVGEYLTR